MESLVINRFSFDIVEKDIEIYFSNSDLLFKKKPSYLKKSAEKLQALSNLKDWLEPKLSTPQREDYVYYTFDKPIDISAIPIKVPLRASGFFKKDYIKWSLINFFKGEGFIVEPFREGCDFSVYESLNFEKNGWGKYRAYDFKIHLYYNKSSDEFRRELTVNIGSEDSYFGTLNAQELSSLVAFKGVHPDTKFLLHKENLPKDSDLLIKANQQKKIQLGIFPKPQQKFYAGLYQTIKSFVETLSTKINDPIQINPSYRTVHPADLKKVDFDKNQMIFGGGQQQVNAVLGMREYGPYFVPDSVSKTKLLFIYPDRDTANHLFNYFRRGLPPFTGLTSYTGIPVEPASERLQYENNLESKFDEFIKDSLTGDFYPEYLAVVITPFARDTASKDEKRLYYKIKEKLLSKGITSQFIGRHRIFNQYFNYHLPNIAIAMLAKRGGIPWKLKRSSYRQLTIGLNIEKVGDKQFLGSAVFFDNEGLIKKVEGLPVVDEQLNLISILKSSIQNYLDESPNDGNRRLVIHYYKPPSQEESKSIDQLIRDELRLNIPFAFVEINDTKSKTDICFDLDYPTKMPQSGTYIRLKQNEFLLFNNLRYWEKPEMSINQEEYPLKIKLYNYDEGGFSYHELISQVYEFSRMHWKGLKQKSHPVTTLYSKLIAEYVGNFEKHKIPANEVSQSTVWFI